MREIIGVGPLLHEQSKTQKLVAVDFQLHVKPEGARHVDGRGQSLLVNVFGIAETLCVNPVYQATHTS